MHHPLSLCSPLICELTPGWLGLRSTRTGAFETGAERGTTLGLPHEVIAPEKCDLVGGTAAGGVELEVTAASLRDGPEGTAGEVDEN